jgi:hypothetical protein
MPLNFVPWSLPQACQTKVRGGIIQIFGCYTKRFGIVKTRAASSAAAAPELESVVSFDVGLCWSLSPTTTTMAKSISSSPTIRWLNSCITIKGHGSFEEGGLLSQVGVDGGERILRGHER